MQAAWEYRMPPNIRIHIHKAPQRSYSTKTLPVQGPKKKWSDDQCPMGSQKKSRHPVRPEPPPERKRDRSPANSDMVAETQMDLTADEAPQVAPATCELEELLQTGWSRRECGGQGDCGYLVAAQGLHFSKHGEFLDAEAAQRSASNLRANVFQHITKPQHVDRYREAFASDPASGVKFQSWDQWIATAGKKGSWIDGLQIQALSEKMGQVLILWSLDIQKDGTAVWQRYTHAPKFSKGFACQAAGSEPISMTLESGHYKLLIPPEGTKFPDRWLRETDLPPSQKLAGAGKSASAATAKSSHAVPDTPSVHTIVRSPHGAKAKTIAESIRSSVPDTPSVHTINPDVVQPAKRLPPTGRVSQQRSHSSKPTLSENSTKRRKTMAAVTTAPEQCSTKKCDPYVPLPEDMSVWWACTCGFQVLQHKDLTCHGPRRKKHLNQVHGIQYSDMPPDPPGAPDAAGTQTKREERLKRCQKWLVLAKKDGWVGMHELTPVNIGWRRWKCQSCNKSFTHWNIGVQTLCSASNAAGAAKVPNPDKRLKLANQWWDQALKQSAKEKADSQEMLNRFSFLNNQQRLSLTKGLPSPPKLFGGIPLVPSEQDGGQPTTWWSCTLCDFKISHIGSSSDRSRKRTNHLKKAHGLQKVPPIARQGFAVRAVQASQSVVKRRWEHRIAEFRKRAWVGSHDIEAKPSCVTLYTCKSGKVLQYPRYRCKRCSRTVTAGDMPISVCARHPSRSKVPSIQRRKKIWQTCLQVAARLSKVADGTSATRRGHRARRVGEAAHPGPSDHNLLVWSVNVTLSLRN